MFDLVRHSAFTLAGLPRRTRLVLRLPQIEESSALHVCTHPDRHRIEMARVAGPSVEAIGAKFEVHVDATPRAAPWRPHRGHGSLRAVLLAMQTADPTLPAWRPNKNPHAGFFDLDGSDHGPFEAAARRDRAFQALRGRRQQPRQA